MDAACLLLMRWGSATGPWRSRRLGGPEPLSRLFACSYERLDSVRLGGAAIGCLAFPALPHGCDCDTRGPGDVDLVGFPDASLGAPTNTRGWPSTTAPPSAPRKLGSARAITATSNRPWQTPRVASLAWHGQTPTLSRQQTIINPTHFGLQELWIERGKNALPNDSLVVSKFDRIAVWM